MANRFAELVKRNQDAVAALPEMSASDRFALLESLEAERAGLKTDGEAKASLDLYRVVEQDLWSWAMRTAFDEREDSGSRKRKPLAEYLLPNLPIADQLKAIADELHTISPGDRFTLLGILNERVHGRAKPAEQLMFMNLHQLTRQSLWTWAAQKALEEGAKKPKRKAVKRVAEKAPAKKGTKPTAGKPAAKASKPSGPTAVKKRTAGMKASPAKKTAGKTAAGKTAAKKK